LLGGVAIGQVHQHRVASRALDQGPDRGAVAFPDDQIALPVAGDSAVIGFGGTLGDVDHVGDLDATLVGLAAGAP
jgi:hypothetical protein